MIKTNLMASVAFAASAETGSVAAPSNKVKLEGGFHPLAVSLAKKISKETTEDMETTIEADETKKMSAVIVAADLWRDFGKQGFASLPPVGSSPETHPALDSWDVYVYFDKEAKKDVEGSVIDDLFDASPSGVRITTWLNKIAAAEADKGDADVGLKKLGKAARRSLKAKYNSQRTTGLGTYRKAIALQQQRIKLEQLMGEQVGFDFFREANKKDGPIINGPKPINLWDKTTQPNISNEYSVTSFLGFDIDKAMELGGDWEALLKTNTRGTGDDEDGDDEDNINVTNSNQAETAMAALAGWMDESKNVMVIYSKINKAKKLEDIEDYMETIINLRNHMDALVKHIDKPWKKLQAKKLSAATGEAA